MISEEEQALPERNGAVHSSQKSGGKRVSVACLPCRTKHLRCDASKPFCKRCTDDGKDCSYAESRRGGPDRAALAARRRAARLPDKEHDHSQPSPEQLPSSNVHPDGAGRVSNVNLDGHYNHLQDDAMDPVTLDGSAPDVMDALDFNLETTFYQTFHRFHPYVLPRWKLEFYIRDKDNSKRLTPVILAVRLIGAIYGQSTEVSERDRAVREAIEQSRAHMPNDPFLVQAALLYAVATFWSGNKAKGQKYLNDAIAFAISLGMFKRDFACAYGEGDAVLEESWRRTWWQLYIVDACFAHIRRDTDFLSRDVPATVDLPCEETDYEAGNIPTPATLEEFDSREFSSADRVYSSFAYLVGIFRGTMTALAATPAGKKSSPPIEVVDAVDAVSDGWLMLLPECKQRVMTRDGDMDELVFYSLMALHSAIIAMHRPFSRLLYDPLEKISSCTVTPPTTHPSRETMDIHTTRCLMSIEAQMQLIMLPKRPFCHTPFTICMITTGMIPFLSACKFVLTEQKLAKARDQIRLSIGCLRVLAKTWPQGGQSVREMQAIAQEVLQLRHTTSSNSSSAMASDEPSSVCGSQWVPQLNTNNDSEGSSSMDDELLFPDTIEGLGQGWNFQMQMDTNLWLDNF